MKKLWGSVAFFVLLAVPSQTAPRSKGQPSTKLDQKQTGDNNIQLHLKNFHIVAVLSDDALGSLGDYDYNYDYADLTIKPSLSSTTVNPSPSSLEAQPETPASSSPLPEVSATQAPQEAAPASTAATQQISSQGDVKATQKPLESSSIQPSTPKVSPTQKPEPSKAPPKLPTKPSHKAPEATQKPGPKNPEPSQKPQEVSSPKPSQKPPEVSSQKPTQKVPEQKTPQKPEEVSPLNAPVQSKRTTKLDKSNEDHKTETPVTNISVVPVGASERVLTEKRLPLGEIMHYKKCAEGFTRDKQGRCRKFRRTSHLPSQEDETLKTD